MRYGVEFHAEESRIVFDIFHHHFSVTQRMRGLQFITRIGHLRHQSPDPVIQLQLKQTAIFGGTDIFPLNDLQVMRNTGQQEDIGKTGLF